MGLTNKHIVITGASFIGSHLIPRLIKERAGLIRVINLTDKQKTYINLHFPDIEFIKADLRSLDTTQRLFRNTDIVIHFAADHGGRGYVDMFQGKTASNFLLDGSVFYASLKRNVRKVFFASSACVYPNYLQKKRNKLVYLRENTVTSPYDADNIYGWAKLMGEKTLQSYYRDFGLHSCIARFFTVFGERAHESHAVMGSIAKAFAKQDPYEIWGDGTQIRNWTYVSDIVDGVILALAKIEDAGVVNLGTTERITVKAMVEDIFKETHYYPKKLQYKNMPTGPLNRVADNRLARKVLGWEPKVKFTEGLKRTVRWYYENHNIRIVRKDLFKLLLGNI